MFSEYELGEWTPSRSNNKFYKKNTHTHTQQIKRILNIKARRLLEIISPKFSKFANEDTNAKGSTCESFTKTD